MLTSLLIGNAVILGLALSIWAHRRIRIRRRLARIEAAEEYKRRPWGWSY